MFILGKEASAEEELNMQQSIESMTGGKVMAKSGEGWTSTISKTEGPDASKTFFLYGGGCVCVVDDSNAVKYARVRHVAQSYNHIRSSCARNLGLSSLALYER
ncbi:hypothetical protein NMG60_11027549 [Bertholletia excelsa]